MFYTMFGKATGSETSKSKKEVKMSGERARRFGRKC